jgi:hypothetical protein
MKRSIGDADGHERAGRRAGSRAQEPRGMLHARRTGEMFRPSATLSQKKLGTGKWRMLSIAPLHAAASTIYTTPASTIAER